MLTLHATPLLLEAIAGAIGAKLIGELLMYNLPGLVLDGG